MTTKTNMNKLGCEVVYPYKAKLFKSGKLIGYCIDTPNAIANAIAGTGADEVKEYLCPIVSSEKYKDRIASWNTAISGLILI